MKNILHNIIFRIVAGLVIFVAVVWGLIAVFSRHSPDYSSAVVARRDLTETVTANGNVTANQSVTLAFNMQGKVANVYADVGSTTQMGEVLASLDTGSLQASLAGAQADVAAAQARLTTLKNGARPEELALYQQKYSDASAALIVAMKNAYLDIENALTGKADALFTNGNSVNPVINIRTQSQTESLSINSERISVGDKLNLWKNDLSALGATATGSAALNAVRVTSANTLSAVKTFLDHLGTIANNLFVGNSGLSQANIDADTAIVNAAAQEATDAANTEQAADAAWSAARDSLMLEQAGSTSEDIQVGQAAIDKAQSVVDGLQSQLRQSYIISPFAGVVTAMNVKVGEIYVPGISATEGVSLISNSGYKIETYVPETDIGKIAVGNQTTITFDAYGPSTVFPAHVTLVDPAETIQNGVNAYKVTVGFDDPSDTRIKSGLTANAVITAKTAANVLAVPSRAIITRGASSFVLIKQSSSAAYIEQPVTTGIQSADGYTEILSGVNEGDVIAGFGAGQ
jgi:HlyD family secretion protein